MTTLNSTIQVRRGTAAQMPTVLLVGELYFQTDTSELYAGTGTSVVPVSGGGGAVASVFGRTGTVVADATDYAAIDNVEVQDTLGQGMNVDTPGGLVDFTAQDEVSIVGGACEINIGDQGDGTSLSITAGGSAAITTDTTGNVLTLAGTSVNVPTPTTSDNSTKVASTEYVKAQASNFDAAGAAATAQSNAEAFATSADTTVLSSAETFATSAVATETTRAEAAEALLVPKTTTVNGHALSGNVVVSASDITTGTLPAAQLPNPSTTTLGGVESITAVTHEYLTSISTSGVPAQARPVLADLSDTPAQNLVVASPNGSSGALSARALVAADVPTLNQSTSGTAANLSGTPALPNGTTATEQAAGSADGKIATDSYVDRAVATETSRAETAEALLAPLASPALTGNPTAPTQAQADNSTKLATTAYADLAGSPSEYVSTISCFFGGISHFGLPQVTSSTTTGFSANKAYVALFYIPDKITVSKATLDITTPSAGSASGGIYSTSGTKLVDTGTFNTNTSGVTTNSFTPVVLTRGWYYYMVTTSTASAGFEYFNNYVPNGIGSLLNQNGVRMGAAPNTSGGAQGSSLGTVTAGSFTTLIAMLFE